LQSAPSNNPRSVCMHSLCPGLLIRLASMGVGMGRGAAGDGDRRISCDTRKPAAEARLTKWGPSLQSARSPRARVRVYPPTFRIIFVRTRALARHSEPCDAPIAAAGLRSRCVMQTQYPLQIKRPFKRHSPRRRRCVHLIG
jgi:hypothetical protein